MNMFDEKVSTRLTGALLTSADQYNPLILGNAATFKCLATGGKLIADTTKFLKELCECDQLVRIILPTMMGKTMLLTMAQSFFGLPKGKKSEKPEDSPNYKLFKNSLIFEDEDFVKKRFGQHPTIYLPFHCVYDETFDNFKWQFTNAIQDVYEDFSYLEDFDNVEQSDKNVIQNMLEWDRSIPLSDEDLQNSIKRLTEILYKFHDQKVLILIDEYDRPVKSIRRDETVTNEDRSKIIEFYDKFLWATFKTNEHLFKGVVAGKMLVTIEGEKHGLKFYECNLTKPNRIAPFFGFSETAVNELCKKMEEELQISIPENHLELAKDWSKSYYFNGNNDEHFYHPYSMSCFLTGYEGLGIRALHYYWVESTHVGYALKKEQIASKLRKLIEPQEQQCHIFSITDLVEEFTSTEYEELSKIYNDECDEINENDIKLLFSFLYHVGHIAFRNGWAVIANNETKTYFRHQIMDYYEKKYAFGKNMYDLNDEFVNLIEMQEENHGNLDTEKLRKDFEEFLMNGNFLDQFFHDETFLQTMFSYISILIYFSDCLINEKSFLNEDNKEMRPTFAFNLSKSMLILELNCDQNGNAKEALERAKFYKSKLFESKKSSVLNYVLLGVHIAQNGKVDIAHDVQMVLDINKTEQNRKAAPVKIVTRAMLTCAVTAAEENAFAKNRIEFDTLLEENDENEHGN